MGSVLKNLQEEDGQSSLRIIEYGNGRFLVFCGHAGRSHPKGKMYPLPARKTGRKHERVKT